VAAAAGDKWTVTVDRGASPQNYWQTRYGQMFPMRQNELLLPVEGNTEIPYSLVD
jgi:hypothetical protein